jgi:hypothetical protein
MEENWLKKILDDDEFGLLRIKPKNMAPTADQHLINKFNEVNEFIKNNNREPELSMANVSEFMLHKRLMSIRSNADHCAALYEMDEHGLLPQKNNVAEPAGIYVVQPKPQKNEIKTLDDIYSDDEFGILSVVKDDIFNLRHVPKDRAESDFVARRKPYKDFHHYKDQFKQVQKELSEGARLLLPFRDNHLRDGGYFVLSGVLLLIKTIDAKVVKEEFASGERTRVDGRTHIIFENGTESNMLYRSIYKQLLKDGKSVSETNDENLAMFDRNLSGLNEEDKATGYIYILQSLSENHDIRNVNNLYKIGYATTSVEKRIANAAKEPTYLMAPVKTVSVYECYNMNAQKFENLIHNFFGNACLEVEIADQQGKMCRPREWFVAPLASIEQAIMLLIKGEIVNYRYDGAIEQVVERR